MSVSCDCTSDYDWFFQAPVDYSILETAQRKRCFSCETLIYLGADVGVFRAWRTPHDDIEERIYGEDGEVPRADFYMCEECVGLYWSITDLGFCIELVRGEPMRELAKLTGQGQGGLIE